MKTKLLTKIVPVLMGKGFDWYVDSASGNDANDGKSENNAFATIAKVLTVLAGGDSVGLAKGSEWLEEMAIAVSYVTVKAYGSGDRPKLNCKDPMANASFSATGGQVNVYEISITPGWTSTDFLNVWEDGAYLTLADDLADCDATQGSYFPSAGAGTIDLYVHASDSSDVTANGKVYEFSSRRSGIYAVGIEGLKIDGIHTTGNLNSYGSIVVGRYATINDCLVEDGGLHNILYGGGSRLVDVHALNAHHTDPNSLFVYNENDGGSLDVMHIRCKAEIESGVPLGGASSSGFFGHNNVAGDFGTVTFDGCEASGVSNGFNGTECAGFVGENIISTDVTTSVIACYEDWTIDGLTAIGSTGRIINVADDGLTVELSNLDVSQADFDGVLLIYSTSTGPITVTNSDFTPNSLNGVNRIFYIDDVAAVMICNNNTYPNGYTTVYYMSNIDTLASDYNAFADNTENFNIDGNSYASVSDYQTGESQDANSTIG